eukprot:m.118722 g.118722  ORF g.118722 m.118722 type:complete len:761 (+) comp37662_c0_seq8:17-2299(+)
MAASITKTLEKPRMQPTRTHDYLYDPNFTLSSARDHARATLQAQATVNRIKRVPHFPTMFSELRHYPRASIQLDRTDPVPDSVSRQWRGYPDQHRATLERYTKFNYVPEIQLPPKQYDNPEVSGMNRFKYSRRPMIPFLQQVAPNVVLAQAREPNDLITIESMEAENQLMPFTRTIGVQTIYRESETQTDPYSPEYVVQPGSQPELLTLATLSYGHGLPAGLAEVEMIERARAKRAWEASLPPLNDSNQMEKRRKLMEEQETNEWTFRETEIEKIQELRLQVLNKMLKEREKEHDSLNTKRLEHLWTKKQQQKEVRVKQLRTEHIKMLRKLTKQRQNFEGKLERRDVIKEYTDFSSGTYAPLTRVGVFPDRTGVFSVKSHLLNTYQGLLELEASLPDYVTQPRIKIPKRGLAVGGTARRLERHAKELKEVDEAIRLNKLKAGVDSVSPLRFLEKVEKPIPRPPTPRITTPPPEAEAIDQSVVLLQQLIRGRAIQNKMFEGKQRRLELIRELRSTHALQAAGQREKEAMKYSTLTLQENGQRMSDKEGSVDKVVEDLAGAQLGQTLDYLGKELVRLQEERRVHAFAMLAERQRKLREAEESGLRQVEERRRRTEDEIFRQLVKVHQSTVDTYLEDIILSSVDKTADQQARSEVRKKAEKINEVAHLLESQRTKLQSEEMVSELVHTFLLPEVEKQTMREKVKRQQRKHIVAAHRVIHETAEEVIASHKVPPRSSSGKLASKSGSDLTSSQSQILKEEDDES